MIVREAGPADAEALSGLVSQLGYPAAPAELEARLARLAQPVLVADDGGAVIGCIGWVANAALHRPALVGRISMMVVDAARRGQGVGRALVEAAEARMRALGCGQVEVSSNMRRREAHAFYERLGYARTSYKFARPL